MICENLTDDIIAKFWDRVDKRGPDECWPWLGTFHPTGYGMLWMGGNRNRIAARVSYAIEHGKDPLGLNVLHSCDYPPCVNPKHLRAGTDAENHYDSRAKGRTFYPAALSGGAQSPYEAVHSWLLDQGEPKTRAEINIAFGANHPKWPQQALTALKRLSLVKQHGSSNRKPQWEAIPGDVSDLLEGCRQARLTKPTATSMILGWLQADGGFYTAREIAQSRGRKLYAVVRILDRLEAGGHIKSYHSEPDRRYASIIYQTAA